MKKKKEIEAILKKLKDLHYKLTELVEEKEGYYEDKSENWQTGETGERYTESVGELDNLASDLEFFNEELGTHIKEYL